MDKIGRNARPIALAKSLNWVKMKIVKNNPRSTLELFCAKNGFRKLLIVEKRQVFENWQILSQCMDYSPCKTLQSCQKFKF